MDASATAFSAPELQEELSRRTGRRVQLVLTDNRCSMVSARRRGLGGLEVRMQRLFLNAPPEVLDDIVALLSGDKGQRPALRAFVDSCVEHLGKIAPLPRRPIAKERLESGNHDIVAYARHLNETYLGGRSRAGVVWGRNHKTRSSRSIRFACYDPIRNLVTMNRKLDRPDIPRYFVEFVLFHELLHEVLGIGERADGKRDIHGSLFRLMEGTYPDYQRALLYEQELCKHLGAL